MAGNLIETIQARLTPDVVDDVASSVGESPSSTKRALTSAVPVIFGGLIRKASTPSGASRLMDEITDADAVGEAGRSTTRGTEFFSRVLGDRSHMITDLVAKESGIGRESSSWIMGFLFPVIASVVGAHATSRGLGVSGFSDMLAKLEGDVLGNSCLPSGAAGALGLGAGDVSRTSAAGATEARHVPPAIAVAGRGAGAKRAAWWPMVAALAAIALIIGGIAYVARRAPESALSPASPGDVEPVAGRSTEVLPLTPKVIPGSAEQPREPQRAGEQTSTTTLTGATIETTTDPLAKAFTDGSSALPQRLTLPNATFDFGTAHLAPGGEASIERLATIMKEHPTAKILLEGFTDSSGGDSVNAPLSYARATAAKKMLVQRGIAEDRIDAVGRREQRPVAENTSAEGRAKNRRIDVVVLSR